MIKAQDFTIVTYYNDVLAEAEAKAKYRDTSMNVKLKEYRKLCKTLYQNVNRSQLERAIIATKSFKAKELFEINNIRRN